MQYNDGIVGEILKIPTLLYNSYKKVAGNKVDFGQK
jgi:hypothetical protein